MGFPAPNRIAVYLTAAGGLATALAPAVADLDTTSTAGLIGGFAGIALIVRQWLVGWQNLEKAEAQDLVHNRAVTREAAARNEAVAQATKPKAANRVYRP